MQRLSVISTLILSTIGVLFLSVSVETAANQHHNKIPEQAQAILDNAEHFELLSINPDRLSKKSPDYFHGWRVLGKIAIEDPELRRKLVAAFKKGVEENRGTVGRCFTPRHGIRVIRGDQTAEFVICFDCYRVYAYVQGRGKKFSDFPFSGYCFQRHSEGREYSIIRIRR